MQATRAPQNADSVREAKKEAPPDLKSKNSCFYKKKSSEVSERPQMKMLSLKDTLLVSWVKRVWFLREIYFNHKVARPLN